MLLYFKLLMHMLSTTLVNFKMTIMMQMANLHLRLLTYT